MTIPAAAFQAIDAAAASAAEALVETEARRFERFPMQLAQEIPGLADSSTPLRIVAVCDSIEQNGGPPRLAGFAGVVPLFRVGDVPLERLKGARRYARRLLDHGVAGVVA